MSRDQQVGITGRLREVQHLLRPRQGLRYAPLVKTLIVSPQRMGSSASWRSSDFAKARAGCRLVQTSGAAQPLSAIHAVPRRVRSPSSLASRCDDRGRVATSSSPWLRWEMASVSGHALQRQLAGGLPKWNGGFDKARFREVMGQHLGFGGLDVREPPLDHARDLGVQLLSAALEQRVVGRVLHQRVLEGVDRIRRRAATEGQSRLDQLRTVRRRVAPAASVRPRQSTRS